MKKEATIESFGNGFTATIFIRDKDYQPIRDDKAVFLTLQEALDWVETNWDV